jgi:hypothetical protein
MKYLLFAVAVLLSLVYLAAKINGRLLKKIAQAEACGCQIAIQVSYVSQPHPSGCALTTSW